MHRFLRKLLLCISLLWLFCLPAAAAVGQPRSGGSYEVLYRNSLAQAGAATTVYYSDRFFSHPATEYDAELALASLTMSLSACTTWDSYTDYAVQGNVGREANLAAAYKQLGFSNAVYFHYDKSRNAPSDSAAYSFAQKTWTENGQTKTILAVFLRGAGYGAEWASNLHLGDGAVHEGFSRPAAEAYTAFLQYLAQARQTGTLGDVSLWLSGYSRSGTIANLLAARILNTLPEFTPQNTYVYTFAASAALTADAALTLQWSPADPADNCIFNLLAPADLVTQLFPAAWGYFRNGKDITLPTPQTPAEVAALNALCQDRLDFAVFPTAAEVSGLAQLLAELAQSPAYYHTHYEALLMDLAQHQNTRNAQTAYASLASVIWHHRNDFSALGLFRESCARLPSSFLSLSKLRCLRICHSPDTYLALLRYYS